MTNYQRRYYEHLQSYYWTHEVQSALRLRARDCEGTVRCEGCGSAKGPYHCHHQSYRYVFREMDALHLMAYLCAGCHEARHRQAIPSSAELLVRINQMGT